MKLFKNGANNHEVIWLHYNIIIQFALETIKHGYCRYCLYTSCEDTNCACEVRWPPTVIPYIYMFIMYNIYYTCCIMCKTLRFFADIA